VAPHRLNFFVELWNTVLDRGLVNAEVIWALRLERVTHGYFLPKRRDVFCLGWGHSLNRNDDRQRKHGPCHIHDHAFNDCGETMAWPDCGDDGEEARHFRDAP